jgi:hypothetical protein
LDTYNEKSKLHSKLKKKTMSTSVWVCVLLIHIYSIFDINE